MPLLGLFPLKWSEVRNSSTFRSGTRRRCLLWGLSRLPNVERFGGGKWNVRNLCSSRLPPPHPRKLPLEWGSPLCKTACTLGRGARRRRSQSIAQRHVFQCLAPALVSFPGGVNLRNLLTVAIVESLCPPPLLMQKSYIYSCWRFLRGCLLDDNGTQSSHVERNVLSFFKSRLLLSPEGGRKPAGSYPNL